MSHLPRTSYHRMIQKRQQEGEAGEHAQRVSPTGHERRVFLSRRDATYCDGGFARGMFQGLHAGLVSSTVD